MTTTLRRRSLVFACLALSLAAHAGGATQAIAIDKFAYVPKEITVAPGTTLVWTNHDQTPHMVMARDKSFSSPALDTDDSYRFTFTKAGDFSYFCSMHPFMTGIVHVRK
ncbi:MAG TPA: cupredoxin family copper-binding protein [Xanthomonadaceae bacterium]|jgi:plastocyanin